VCIKTLQRRRSPRIPWGFGSEISGGTVLSRVQARIQICEALREREKRLRPLDFEVLPRQEESAQKRTKGEIVDRRMFT
jgi:hypothetical protein